MARKIIIRISPDDQVHVMVEGLTETDRPRPKGKKLCEKITKRIEKDLGLTAKREYPDDGEYPIQLNEEDVLRLGES